MNNFGRNLALWVIIIVLFALLYKVFQPETGQHAAQQLAYSDFVSDVNHDTVRSVVIQNQNISGTLKDGTSFETFAPFDPDLVSRLTAKEIEVTAKPVDADGSPLLRFVINYLPPLMLFGLGFLIFRQMQSGSGRAMGFGKSRARLLTEKQGRVTFEDVAGIDEAKGELEEIVDFLKDPQKFTRLGGKIPKGALLVGPPGTGKTLLARAIAGEANVPFFTISGSDFVEMFVGVGASRVRDMFEQGKKSAPCIIFIDEIDAVGRHRGAGMGGGNDEREQTLNQMLVEMDGFESNEGVVLIAATNRPDVLDRALLRPGRFDRQITVPNPDIMGREKILRVHMKKTPLSPDVDPKVIARGTPGFSGADLANLVNEAALLAARQGRRTIGMAQFEAAKDKVLMGVERRSAAMDEQEKRVVAYHEAGHAICGTLVDGRDPIHKATIIPRGQAAGMVVYLPEKDPSLLQVSPLRCRARLVTGMGGRAAEEIIFGQENVSAGAYSDIRGVTGLARQMVTEWGMSPQIGMISYDNGEYGGGRSWSEQTAREIDVEIKSLIDDAYAKSRAMLEQNIESLHRLAGALLEFETLTGDEVAQIMRGEQIVRIEADDQGPDNRRASVPPTSSQPSGDTSGLNPAPAPG